MPSSRTRRESRKARRELRRQIRAEAFGTQRNF